MARARTAPDWPGLLKRWDSQQEGYHPDREPRFSAMFDIAEATLGRRFRAIDLGAGPGSLSARLLRRFPRARCVAVDYDPVVLRVGREAVGTVGGRLAWVDARLGSPGWTERLPPGRFDVAFSTTALHWLRAPALGRLYADLHRLLRPGGLFLNGDRMAWGSDHPWLARLAREVRDVRFPAPTRAAQRLGWERWWREAERLPALREEFREQARRGSAHPKGPSLPIDAHERALARARFREIAVVWQDLDDRVLVARR